MSNVTKRRKVVQALRWDGSDESSTAIREQLEPTFAVQHHDAGPEAKFVNLINYAKSDHYVIPGDWVVACEDPTQGCVPVSDDEFSVLYEPVHKWEYRECLEDAADVLTELEWITYPANPDVYFCPDCKGWKDEGHAEDCGLEYTLQSLEREEC